MPRKKAKNSKIAKINRKTMYLSENMENDFRAIPNKLPAQLDKELNGLKKQENKLQSSLLKMQKQQAVAKNKHAALASKAKNNLTATVKKQIKVAQKTLEMLTHEAMKLSAQLTEIQQHGKILSQKQAKFSAICKYIALMDEKWEKKAKKDKPKAIKVKAAQPKKSRKNVQVNEELIAAVMPNKKEPARTETTPETVEASSKK
jgi:hypothetical protein